MLKLKPTRMKSALLSMRKENPLQLNGYSFPEISESILKAQNNNYLCNIAPDLPLAHVYNIIYNSNDNHYYYRGLFCAMRRKSKQREAILRVLKGTDSHPTADWVYAQVRAEIPNISLGTVYRNLKLLKEEGQILELDLAGTGRFDGNTRNHYHFVCERCGRIFDLDEPVHKEQDERVAKKMGFKVLNHLLEFRGLCKDCQS